MTQAIQSQWALLGGLLLDNSRFQEIDLSPDDFVDETHRQIFVAMTDLLREGRSADAITVSDYLQNQTGRDWLHTVATLANHTPGSANVATYAKIVRDEAVKRRALEVADGLRVRIQEEGLDAVDSAIRDLMLLSSPRRDFECSVTKACADAVDEIDRAYQSGGKVHGVTTGLVDLDECLGGLHNSDLIVVAARPAVGKTAMLINLADNAGVPVGIISGEQGRSQIGMRLIAKNGRLNAYRMRIGKIDDEEWPRITSAVSKITNKHIWINDRPNPTIEELMRQARKWRYQHGIKALYVDYLQRIRALPKAVRHEQIGFVALSLKELARELDIPVVALAQVNRNVEGRENKRPSMGDIKDSGSIEQEADIVITMYRDDVYDENSPDAGIVELNVAKNRHGPTGLIRCTWEAKSMTFNNIYQGAA